MIKEFAEAASERNLEELKKIALHLNIEEKNIIGRTGLHIASYHGDKEICEILLERESDLDSTDNWGDTPLHTATIYNHPEIVKLLIEKGANLEIDSNFGLTPLLLSIGNGRLKVTDILLKSGANPNTVTRYGSSGFQLLSRQKNPKWKLLMMKYSHLLSDENKNKLDKEHFHVSWDFFKRKDEE